MHFPSPDARGSFERTVNVSESQSPRRDETRRDETRRDESLRAFERRRVARTSSASRKMSRKKESVSRAILSVVSVDTSSLVERRSIEKLRIVTTRVKRLIRSPNAVCDHLTTLERAMSRA